MALKMPGPIELGNGVFHLNIRVPKDLVTIARGAKIALPVGDRSLTVTIGDKVIVSLRTKDRALARERFRQAEAAVRDHWKRLRSAPQTLSHRQIVALAGEAYRDVLQQAEADFDADRHDRNEWTYQHHVRTLCERNGWSPEKAHQMLMLMKPNGLEIMAILAEANIVAGEVGAVTYEDACEKIVGDYADQLLGRLGINLDETARKRLLKEIGRAFTLTANRLHQFGRGDYSPDPHLTRFPGPEVIQAIPFSELQTRWTAHAKTRREPSTVRRYAPSLNSFASFIKTKDIRLITDDDVFAWAEHRRDGDGIDAHTVNGNDLVAVASVFTYAMSREGKRLIKENPAKGVKLDAPKKRKLREPTFKIAEAQSILRLARSVKPRAKYPRASASRRWAPFICAYSGARIQEVCWLEKHEIWNEGGIWVMSFRQTKTHDARTIPLHDALIAEGFLDFVDAAPPGPLFYGDKPTKKDAAHPSAGQRASEVAAWIRAHINLEEGVDPNHAWRHSFITRATGKFDKRIQNAICGHNKNKDASDGYYTATIEEMSAALKKFPVYL